MKLFFSYGHDINAPLVDMIAVDLVRERHTVWIDHRNIHSGDDWRRAITQGILSSEVTFAFASSYSVRNPGVCLDELSIAVGVKGAYVQSVLLESNVDPPKNIRYRQAFDMRSWCDHVSNEDFLAWYNQWTKDLAAATTEERSSVFGRYARDWRPASEDAAWWHEDERFMAWYGPYLARITELLSDPEVASYATEVERLRVLLAPDELDAKRKGLEAETYSGRKWLRELLDHWAKETSESLLLITGAPGVGKSSFVAHELLFDERVGAAVYCEWNNPASNSVERIARSLAFQLACRFPDYRSLLMQQMEREQMMGEALGSVSAFERYVLKPLQPVINANHPMTILLVDGIDELDRPEGLRGGASNLAELIVQYAGQMPSWIRFVVTCRRESPAVKTLRDAHRIDIAEDEQANRDDVAEYVRLRLGSKADESLEERVVTASGGIFLHAALICDELEKGQIAPDEVSDCIEPLGAVYTRYFRRMFQDAASGYGGASLEGCYEAMSVLATCEDAVPLRTLRLAAGWDEPHLQAFLRRCANFLIVRNELASFTHKSMSDWLRTAESGEYEVDKDVATRCLADACLMVYDDGDGVDELNEFELVRMLGLVKDAKAASPVRSEERRWYADMYQVLVDDDGLAQHLGSRGWDWLGERRYHLAEACADSVLAIAKARQRSHRHSASMIAVTLGNAWLLKAECINATMRLEEAIRACDEGVDQLKRLDLEQSDREVQQVAIGRLLTKKGYVLYRMDGRNQEAIQAYEGAFSHLSHTREQNDAIEALVRLGFAYRADGKPEKAAACSDRIGTFGNLDELRANDPQDFCWIRISQAGLLLPNDRTAEAEQLLLEAREVAVQAQIILTPLIRGLLALELSNLMYRLGRYAEGKDYALEALRFEREVYGARGVETCNGLNQVGNCLLRLGRAEEALAYFEQSRDLRCHLYGDQNHWSVFSIRNCALAKMALGGAFLDDARKDLEHVLRVRRDEANRTGTKMKVTETLLDLSDLSRLEGAYAESLRWACDAEATYAEMEAAGKTVNGRSRARMLKCKGEALLGMGDAVQAVSCLEQALALFSASLGPDSSHPALRDTRRLIEQAHSVS